MTRLLRGAPVAAAITEDLRVRSDVLRARGVVPTLAVVRVGERADARAYEARIRRCCAAAGIEVRTEALPEDCTRAALLSCIRGINAADEIHGCLLLRPLPDAEAEAAACALLDPAKDVDGMTPASLAGVFAGTDEGYAPCTAEACVRLLEHYAIPCAGRHAVVVGRSLVVGRPAAMLLLRRDATVTVCHSRTAGLPALCRAAEIVIAAAGQPELLTADAMSPGQTLIDVGIHVRADGTMCGDVRLADAEALAGAVAPSPGGVGAVTAAVLCAHTVDAAERASGIRK